MMGRTTTAVASLTALAFGCSEVPLDAVKLPPALLVNDLVAHWKLDEGEGAVAGDDSGHGHLGSVNGASWITDGRFGRALRFVEGNGITVAGFPSATPNWSVSLWIRWSDEQLAANADTWTTVLSTENIASGGWEVNLDRQLTRPRYVFSYWAPPLSNYVGVECSCVETGAWHHIAAVVDSNTDRISLYRDGTLVDQTTRPSDIPEGDSTLHFAHWNMNGRFFSGDLDDIAVWQRALTDKEVSALVAQSP